MRHISHGVPPSDQEWLTKAGQLLVQLQKAPSEAARKKIIDDNSAVWGELKQWLLGLSHEKCWFSEAKDCFSHWDVEHYRPKKRARDEDGTEHPGYWWLAFDWTNLRICGNAGNRKKGTYFPLRPGTARVVAEGDVRLESPMLLDPADEDDPNLISFNMEGDVIPAPGVTDPWEVKRVHYTVERCKLDFGPLTNKRKAVWADCWTCISEYLAELERARQDASNTIARDRSKQAMKRLRQMLKADRELSAVARACVLSSNDPRVTRVLQT